MDLENGSDLNTDLLKLKAQFENEVILMLGMAIMKQNDTTVVGKCSISFLCTEQTSLRKK